MEFVVEDINMAMLVAIFPLFVVVLKALIIIIGGLDMRVIIFKVCLNRNNSRTYISIHLAAFPHQRYNEQLLRLTNFLKVSSCFCNKCRLYIVCFLL